MAGHEWPDWFEREELIGQISDIRVQNLQVEREVVQKRTFTRWMNLHLEKCNPPLQVHDLFRDLQDGRILMALLEELSGCSLLHGFKASSHRIFRLNNIAKVLAFLEERNVKLVSIDAADVADGNSSIVLGLIWNIILFFQIKELTGNIRNQFPSSSSLSSIPTSSDSDTSHSSTPSDERRPSFAARDHGKAIKTLLQWVQRRTRKYGVAVQDFGKSWMSGLAFLAVIKSIDPSLVDMRRALLRSSRENIEEAFRTAHYSLGIPRLLEPEDVTLDPPDEQSIMTYVSQFLEHFPGIEEDEHSDFLERSKVSARMNEPPVRNGVRRKREKSYVVKRDWVQPPPKIFVSSVTEEQEHTPSPTEDRPWASEESSVGSSPSSIDSHPPCHQPEKSPNKDTSSASGSPHPSLIDSAMDSTDSWAEMPSELQQSCSDFSLSEGATPEMLKYSTSVGELTPDSELPPLLESASHDPTDPELFTDEGNFSIGSVESLQAKSILLSEEEDAYRYILDLKEERSDNHTPSEDIVDSLETQQTQTCQDQSPETVKPAPYEPLCEDSDSGYYPGHKDVSATMKPDDVSESLSFAKSDSEVADVRNAVNTEHSKEILEPSTLQDLQKVLTKPDQSRFLEDDAECPVLRYERISISESEEDIEEAFCAEPSEETLPSEAAVSDSLSDVFESNTLKEDSEKDEERLANFVQAVEIDQVSNSDQFQEQPAVLEAQENNLEPGDEADQACSDPQILSHSRQPGTEESEPDNRQDNSQDFESAELLGLSDAPVIEDLAKAISQASSGTVLETDFPDFTKTGEEMSCKFNYSEVLEVGECNEQTSQEDAVVPQEKKTEDELNKVSVFTEDTQSATECSGDGEKLSAEFFLSDGQKSETDVVKEKEEVEVFNKVASPPEDAPSAAERPNDNVKVDSKESHMNVVKDKEEVIPHKMQYTSDSKLNKVRNLPENAPNATEDSGEDEMFSEGQQNENSIVKEVVEPCEPRYISDSVLNKVTVPPEDSPSAAEPPGNDMKVTAELFSSESQQSETAIVKEKDEAKSTNQPQLSTTDSDPINSCDGAVPVSASAASKEPDRGPVFAEEEERPFTPPTPYSPLVSEQGLDENWDRGTANHSRDEGHATWEERQRIVGSAERSERFPAELRLSLSVTPLLPAPSQAGIADSDGERSAQEKVRGGSVESPGQSPFELWSRHPGEWGALETDLPTDLSELTNSDEELTSATNATTSSTAAATAAARENSEELREEVKNDGESRRSTDLYTQETTGPEELQEKENCDTTDALTSETANERNESRTAENPVKTCEMDVTEIYLLLVMWLLLYCLLVLPQMDVWTLPSLLLNLNPS